MRPGRTWNHEALDTGKYDMTMTTGRSPWTFGVIVSGLLLIVATSCSLERKSTDTATENDTAPQAGAPEAATDYYQRPAASFVANPFCKACHLDFDEDELAIDHELAGIGCERCHGESLRHRSDEANVTPPQLMYPKERINPTCMMCHPRHAIQHVGDHLPILEAGLSVFEEEGPSGAGGHTAQYCMDCHGPHHRMKVRTVRWDKCTGAVLQ